MNNKSKLKVIYITNIFPIYRLALWKSLLECKFFDLSIMYSKKNMQGIKGVNILSNFSNSEREKIFFIKNYTLLGKIFWQSKSIIFSIYKDFDVFILLGDMSIISNWLVSIICRLRGKKIIFWTHGIYGNESKLKLFFRLSFLKLAHKILLYENAARNKLIQKGFDADSLHVVFNSLDYNKQREIFNKLLKNQKSKINDKKTIIFVGRLTKVKKLYMLIDVINNLNRNKQLYYLTIVGDGPQREKLMSLSKKGIKNGFINFKGSLYKEEEIAKLIFNSDLCVSPGNVGLTCIHSLTYGTPVCTHGNFVNQMPEVEAIINGKNGIFFKENDIKSLEKKILEWFAKYHQNYSREIIREPIDRDYNPSNQIKIITNMLKEWQN